MAQGLLSLCLFFISVIGILLFRPDPLDSLTRYSEPARLEERKRVTRKMVELLEKHPEVVAQTLKMSNTSLGKPIEAASSRSATPSGGIPDGLSFPFQGQSLEFKSRMDVTVWVQEKIKSAPREFIEQITRTEMDPSAKLELLTTAAQTDSSDAVLGAIKDASLTEAKKLLKSPQAYDQHMSQKFLEFYIEKESDPKVGKETVDELLKASNSPPESP